MTKIQFSLKPAKSTPRVTSFKHKRGALSKQPEAAIAAVRSTQHVGRNGGRPPGLS